MLLKDGKKSINFYSFEFRNFTLIEQKRIKTCNLYYHRFIISWQCFHFES